MVTAGSRLSWKGHWQRRAHHPLSTYEIALYRTDANFGAQLESKKVATVFLVLTPPLFPAWSTGRLSLTLFWALKTHLDPKCTSKRKPPKLTQKGTKIWRAKQFQNCWFWTPEMAGSELPSFSARIWQPFSAFERKQRDSTRFIKWLWAPPYQIFPKHSMYKWSYRKTTIQLLPRDGYELKMN